MVIVHVLSSFGLGGQERMALELAHAQRDGGDSTFVVALAPQGPLDIEFRKAGVVTRYAPKRPGFDFRLFGHLARLFTELRADIVHTHNPQPMIYAAPAAKLAGASVVHTKHGANPDLARRRWLRRLAAAFVDAYVAVSPATAAVAKRYHECARRKLFIIANGIDVRRFGRDTAARQDVRQELGISEHAWVVGTIGRLAPEKDQLLLIRAMAPLLGEHRQLVIVGEGPERPRLERELRQLEDARFVHLTGARRDAGRMLAAFDAFALTSTTEGLPLVIPEAMAAGLPIVSTAVGGIVDVLDDGRTGFLVPPENVAALRTRLFELSQNPILASRVGTAARQAAIAQYSSGRMLNDYSGLYEQVRHRRNGLSVSPPAGRRPQTRPVARVVNP